MIRMGIALLALSITTAGHADSLRDIYELALANDAQLKAEEAQYRSSLEQENLSRSALLPQINASYDYGNNDAESTSEAFGSDFETIILTNIRDVDTQGYTVNLNQALFDLPAWFSFKSGKELTKQAEAAFAADQQNLIVRTVEAYLAVLRAQDNLKASLAQERAFERQLEQTRQRFEVGLIAITDVYEAQAGYDLAQVTRIGDENNVLVALEGLSVLTGRMHSNLNVLVEEFVIAPPEPNDRSQWVDFALANNFELKAAEFREEAARQAAKANRMEHMPRVSGTVGYQDFEDRGTLTQDPPGLFDFSPDSDRNTTSWNVRVDLPLFSGGAISARRRQAAADFLAAQEQRINLNRNTVTNARSLHMTVNNDVQRVNARKQSIVSSRSALDATQAGYEVGTRNIVDVLNQQNLLSNAERDYANSRYDYITNVMRLKEQAGLLSPEDIYRLDVYLEPPPPPTATTTK